VARTRPDLVLPGSLVYPEFSTNRKDLLARMHAAMLFGHLALYEDVIPQVLPVCC
jgi:hypothetical protein